MERAHRRLEHLYEISKILTRSRDVERAVPEVVTLVAQTLPVRSAIFIAEVPGFSRAIAWQAEGESGGRRRSARW
jgi:hypothetical protein